MTGLNDFHERRFLGALKALVDLLRQHQVEKWADWFAGDLSDYLAAQGPPRQVARQQAVVEHILLVFGGMSSFNRVQLLDQTGHPSPEANQRLQFLVEQLWAATRGVQGMLQSTDIS